MVALPDGNDRLGRPDGVPGRGGRLYRRQRGDGDRQRRWHQGSPWTLAEALYVGNIGTGSLAISAGGVVTTSANPSSFIGWGQFADGAVTVSGAGSQWTNSGWLYIGISGARAPP